LRAELGAVARASPAGSTTSFQSSIVCGPAGSGKTAALAARAVDQSDEGDVAVVCPNASSVQAFERALLACERGDERPIRVDTLAGHAARWMRSEYAASGVPPNLRVGSSASARRAIEHAAHGLLDLSWPMFQSGDFDLDLPFLSRPGIFLDEAAGLFRLLRRLRLTPEEFAEGCSAGADAFYGEGVEGALARLRDPQLRERLSKRGATACAASRADVQAQRRAESALAKILVKLYEEYVAALPGFAEWCEEDVVAHACAWLEEDARAARAIARRHAALLVDDAEDADPGLASLANLLAAAGLRSFIIAGNDDAQIDSMAGKRSALTWTAPGAQRKFLAPIGGGVRPQAQRFAGESAEADRLAAGVGDLLRAGVEPGDIAILSRSVDSAAVYRRELDARGLPVLAPTEAFEAQKEIEDLLALAAIVDDRFDHAHLLRVLSSPLPGLNDASVWTLCTPSDAAAQLTLEIGARSERRPVDAEVRRGLLSRNAFDGAADDRLSEDVRARLGAFRDRFAGWQRMAKRKSPPAVIAELMHDAGFRARWHDAAPHRCARLAEDGRRLVEAVRSLHEAEPELRLRDAVCRIEDGEATLRAAALSRDGIACEAIAATKGRRWPHVFVAGVAYERFPRIYNARGMAFSRNYGLLVRDNIAGRASQTAKFAWFYAKFDAKGRYLTEERKILRYGLSRANVAAAATGFGRPPHWARDYDLLSELGA
jgi:superfamily I DNA/RNA helicase